MPVLQFLRMIPVQIFSRLKHFASTIFTAWNALLHFAVRLLKSNQVIQRR